MNDNNRSLILYKDLGKQWWEKINEVGDNFDHPDIKELDNRMKIVWQLLTKEERSEFFLQSQKQLANRFTQSFEATWQPLGLQGNEKGKIADGVLNKITKELKKLENEDL